MKKDDCIFCKLANGDIPTNVVYEDQDFTVIMDASPATKGHCLILPKEHYANIYELDDTLASKVFVLAKKMATMMTEKLGCDGFNIVQNNGETAGQTVFHFHMHLIPRYKDDNQKISWNPTSPSADQQKTVLDLLKAKKIILTGGGTAGHVTPNIALIPALQDKGYSIEYIGSYNGIEKTLIGDMNIPYHGISTGKLRRYFDLKNFTDPFRVIKGFTEAKKIMKTVKPDVVFSKGGFVSVPVVKAAKKCKIPVIIHESDMTPGLANKLSFSSASKICCNFPETVSMLPKDKAVLTGSPIRHELFTGDKNKAKEFCGFADDKPVLMVMGGSLGALHVNEAVRKILPKLLGTFNVIHLCGKGKVDNSLTNLEGYKQYEYIKDELKDLFALSDILISRSGANAICEILALGKPNILIPLPAKSSRGDQILNARSFEKQGFSVVIEEDELTDELLLSKINDLYENRQKYTDNMLKSDQKDSVKVVTELIESLVK